ncbi:MAG TPA: MBL fold metallo-hydrolase [bacterium]|nr:MBL fold metallo-hydrolase [bacterium]
MDFSVHKIVVGSFQENTWYVVNRYTNDGILIDPGEDVHTIEALFAETESKPTAILNTHAHIDHIGAIQRLQEKYDLPFYLHREDQFLLEQYPEQAALFGVKMQGIPDVTHFLEEGSKTISEIEVRVLHTPGHSPGSVSFVIGNDLFSGDALFAGSIGRTDLPGGDYAELIRSIQQKLLPLGDHVVVHAGHGPDTTIGEERRTNPFLREG